MYVSRILAFIMVWPKRHELWWDWTTISTTYIIIYHYHSGYYGEKLAIEVFVLLGSFGNRINIVDDTIYKETNTSKTIGDSIVCSHYIPTHSIYHGRPML